MDTVLTDKQDWHAPAIDLLVKSRSDGIGFHIIFTIVDIVFVEKANRVLAGGAPDRTEHQDIRRTFRIQRTSLVALLAGYRHLVLAIAMLDRHTLCLNNDKQDEQCKYVKPWHGFSLSSGLSGFKAEPACFDTVSCFSLQLENVFQCKPGHAMDGSPQVIKNGQHHEH